MWHFHYYKIQLGKLISLIRMYDSLFHLKHIDDEKKKENMYDVSNKKRIN